MSRRPLEYTERVRGLNVKTEGRTGTVVEIEERGEERPAAIEVLWDDGSRSTEIETDLRRA